MYRPYDVHCTLRCVGFQLAGLLFVGLVCLPACGDRVLVVRELSLQPQLPDAAASAPDAGSHKPPLQRRHEDKDDKDDPNHR